LEDGRLCFVLKLQGIPFESVTDATLENQFDALNHVFMTQGKSTGARLAVWCFHDHFQTKFQTNYQFSYEWLRDFSARYMARFEHADVYENAFYIAMLLKPGVNDTLDEAIRDLEEIQQMMLQSLRAYECDLLRMYERNGMDFSEVYEFIGYLYNGFWEPVPVTSLPLWQAVETSSHHHGYKLIETRFPDGDRMFTAFYDLKDYPDTTTRGRMNPMLELRFPFLMVFSFTFLNIEAAIRLMDQALNKMVSAGDEAVNQQAEIAVAKGELQGGNIHFGEFHGAMLVRGRTARECEERGATARTTLAASCGAQYVAASISAPETFFSIFPGNTTRRPRPMPKTTRNLFGVFAMNTYSSGKQFGNPIGDGSAVVPVHTSVRGIYHLNFHYSLPELDSLGEKRAGHTFICGATGAGKTTLQTSLLTFLERFGTKMFGIDKDGSMRGFIEALGGTYFTLPNGEPTGLNPFQLPDTPYNRSFLYDLVAACGRFGRPATEIESAEDILDIKSAVDNVFSIPWEHRRFAVLLQNIPDRGADCLKRRIAQWCYTEDGDGRFAYALDNPTNAFDWRDFRRVGFDVTDFLVAGHPATEPILSYLFHLKNLMQRERGGLLATVVEECWLPMLYPTTSAQILDSLKTGRRRDEFILLVTQSPEDILKNPLLPAVMQQTPTKIYLPNPDAEFRTMDGGGYARFGLTIKEFRKLKSLGLQSRKFLIKQGSQSSVVGMDLGLQPGQPKGTLVPAEYVPVFAMAAEDFPLLEEAKALAGNEPDDWIPEYQRLRKLRNEKAAAAAAAGQQARMEAAA
jgi:type IV secretion system protein VirB4